MVDATDVYWFEAEPAELHRTPKTGGSDTLLATNVDAFTLDSDVIYHAAFAIDGGAAEILALPKAGGPSSVVTTMSVGHQLTVDGATLYFVGDGAVNAVPKIGGTPQPITSNAPKVSLLVGVDATSVYWISTDGISSATIWSTPKTGGPSAQLAQTGVIMRAVLDSGAIYFTTDARDVEKLVIATSERSVLVTGLGTYGGENLAVHSGTVDQQEHYPAIILAVPTNGGAAVDTCAGGFMNVAEIAADDTTLYWGLNYEAVGQILSKPR